jgi:hypothetical protein
LACSAEGERAFTTRFFESSRRDVSKRAQTMAQSLTQSLPTDKYHIQKKKEQLFSQSKI